MFRNLYSSRELCSPTGLNHEVSPVQYLLDRVRPDLERKERRRVPVDVKIVQRSFRTCRETGIPFRRAFVSLVLPLEVRRPRGRRGRGKSLEDPYKIVSIRVMSLACIRLEQTSRFMMIDQVVSR